MILICYKNIGPRSNKYVEVLFKIEGPGYNSEEKSYRGRNGTKATAKTEVEPVNDEYLKYAFYDWNDSFTSFHYKIVDKQ
mgnify:CR=1 FL=1